MRFWWVNHKQTYKSEIRGGYIWSPSRNNSGSFNQGYKNLTLAKVGDPIFSYADTYIKAIGIVKSTYVHSAVPTDFGSKGDQWAKGGDGYLVEIKWDILDIPFKPKTHIQDLKDLLPTKYSPIRKTGDGNQGIYLSEVGADLFKKIIELIDKEDSFIIPELEELSDLAEEEEEQQNIDHSNLSKLEKEQLIKARIGQGKFKTEVAKVEEGCRITKITDKRFLTASHIKPWSKSSNQEKLDGNNGFLLSPHIDRLFDKGWITFSTTGDILIAKTTPKQLIKDWNITTKNVGSFNKKQELYLKYHREYIFRDNRKVSPVSDILKL